MSAGSWIRFAVAFILALETLRLWLSSSSSSLAAVLSILYVILAIAFFVFRF